MHLLRYRMFLALFCMFQEVISNEKKLFTDLMERYKLLGKHGRPVVNPNKTVLVQFSFALYQLLAVDEKSQTIKTIVWNSYKWTDEYLTWNETEYGGVTSLSFPTDYIWTPSVGCYTKSDKTEFLLDAELTLLSNGSIYQVVPTVMVTSCAIDITRFPVDEQICHFKFMSWNYDDSKQKLDFLNRTSGLEIDLSWYQNSTEWELIGQKVTKYDTSFDGVSPVYTGLNFTIRIKRNPIFYELVIVKPALVLSAMTIFMFLMPPSATDRYCYGAGLFAAEFFLLIIVADLSPHGTLKSPLLGIYLYLNLFLVISAMGISAIVIGIHDYTEKTDIGKIVDLVNLDKDTEPKETAEGPKMANKNRTRMLKGCARKLPVIIDRLAVVLFIVLEMFFYYVFIPK